MLGMNEEVALEQSYQIARGVRTLAIVGHCPADDREMLETASRLETIGDAGAIPFVAPRSDGVADYGYAASKWAIELLQWAESDAVPVVHRHRILGLLLGYSVDAIRMHEEMCCGRLFDQITPGGRASR
jgi:hypothetical protein